MPLDAVYRMELWELTATLEGIAAARKADYDDAERSAVLIGAYSGHYINAGRRATPPSEFIERIYAVREDISADRALDIIAKVDGIIGGKDG